MNVQIFDGTDCIDCAGMLCSPVLLQCWQSCVTQPGLRLINGEVMTWRLETRRAENNQARCGITGAQTAVIHPDWTEPLDHTSTIKTAKKRNKKDHVKCKWMNVECFYYGILCPVYSALPLPISHQTDAS